MRVADGEHLCNSSNDNVWAVNSSIPCNKNFIKEAVYGDRLWFVTSKTGGKIVAVATFVKTVARELGPLISLTPTNEERGWTSQHGNWDTDVFYEKLYIVSHANLLTQIKSPGNVRKYNEKCKVNLPIEYQYIEKYLKPVKCITKTDL